MKADDKPNICIYIVDDETEFAKDLGFGLDAYGQISHHESCESFLQQLDPETQGLVFCDFQFDPNPAVEVPMQGPTLLLRLVAMRSSLVAVMCSGRQAATEQLVEDAFMLGLNSHGQCVDYLSKPISIDTAQAAVQQALDYARVWAPVKQRQRRMVQALLERITPAELVVMEGALKGLSARQIAEVQWDFLQQNPQPARKPKVRPKPPPAIISVWPLPGWPSAAREAEEPLPGEAKRPEPRTREEFLAMRAPGIEFQRNHVNNHDLRLRPLDLRISDFAELLLLPGIHSLQAVLAAEINLRLSLLTPEQHTALVEAAALGSKAPVSDALSGALRRVQAGDVKTFNRWRAKLDHLAQYEPFWPPRPPGPELLAPPVVADNMGRATKLAARWPDQALSDSEPAPRP